MLKKTSQVLTLVRPMLLHRMAPVSVRLFGQLAGIFWANGLTPPWQKIARTPMSESKARS